jgi:hypothetical protein
MSAFWKHMTRFGLVLGVQALLLGCGVAVAAPLDQDACARFKTELLQLELAGTRNDMAKGPEWAKVNLSADKLSQIKRLMEVEEQLLFRCQGKPLVVLPEGVDGEAAPAPAAAERGKEAAGAAKAPAIGKAAKETQPPGKAQAKQPAASKGPGPAPGSKAPAAKTAIPDKTAPAAPPAAQAKPKPKAKPKVDDAYRPPPALPAGPDVTRP